MSEHKAIFKSASVISGFTVLSRITGFVRDVLIANLFGTGVAAQAFFVAFKIPNAFRDIMGEGAGNAAFVPVFCEYIERKPRADFLRLVNSLLWVLLCVSCVVTLCGVIFSPVIIRLVAPGFSADIEKFNLAVILNRYLFPYLILITISAYLMSVSNALKSFAVPASSSIVYNIVFIAGIYLITRTSMPHPVYALCVAVLIAGIIQIFVQLPAVWKVGIDFRKGGIYQRFFYEPAILKVGRLIFPRLLGTSIYQLNLFVDTIFASLAFFVGDGAIAAIYYANRIIQFPFAIFGVALSNAALPAMSSSSAQQEMDKFKKTLQFCLKAVFLGVIPLTVGILALSYPLTCVIFKRGSFDEYSTRITAQAVFFFAFGLVSYVGVRFLSHAFYALQDTRTPVKTSAIGLLLNIIFNSLFIFVFRFKIAGLALASSISATVNFYLLYRFLQRKIGFTFSDDFKRLVFKACASSLVMGVLVFWVWHQWCAQHPTFLNLSLVACLGAASYLFFLMIARTKEVGELVTWLRNKK
jgi:putative peptidoglycan lipid II flippase